MTTLVHVSDVHFGNEDPGAIAAAAAYIAAHRPDAVIASGDLTALGSQREMRAAFDWLRSLAAPVLATPGNHDTPYFDILPRLFNPFGGFFSMDAGVRTEAWATEKFVIAPINTARGVQLRKNWALGAISRAQAEAAGRTLRAAPGGALRIVVSHHPLAWPANAPISGDTRGGPAAMRLLIEAGADIFLSGHLHLSAIATVAHAGRRAVTVSAGTLSIRHRGEPGGFIVIRYTDGARIEIEQMIAVGGRAMSAGVTVIDRETVTSPADGPSTDGRSQAAPRDSAESPLRRSGRET